MEPRSFNLPESGVALTISAVYMVSIIIAQMDFGTLQLSHRLQMPKSAACGIFDDLMS